jgi:membrane associated rhomboid family serine protease
VRRYDTTERGPVFGLGSPITPGVRTLLIANAATYVLFNLVLASTYPVITDWLGLSSRHVLHGRVWQLVTYLFLHGTFMHLLLNMFYLYMFGGIVERAWGTDRFLRYFFITGVGAGIVWTLLRFNSDVPTIGASGSVYAVLLAFGVLFPNSTVLFMFLFPMRAKWLVALFIGIEVIYLVNSANDGVAHLIHLAGAAIGYYDIRRGIRFGSPIERIRRWRTRRRLSVIDYRELLKFDDERDDYPRGRGRGG